MNAIKTAKNLEFRLSLGTHSEATKNRWFWFVDASGRAGEAWRIIRKGLDLNSHPGFDTEEAAAVDAIRAMVRELQAVVAGTAEPEPRQRRGFIKLTDFDGNPLWTNTAHIVNFMPTKGGTALYLTDRDVSNDEPAIIVKETCEQILELL